jgi:dTDP-4-dehydrorhamnose reductase
LDIRKALLIGHGLLGNAVARVAAERGISLGVADLPDVDITDAGSVDRLVATAKPDAIILTAAYTRVDDCETNAELAMRVNADGAANVARAAAKVGARLVFYSTDYVFDGVKGAPYVEDDPPNPLSVYGRSKLAGEENVKKFASDSTIIRTASLFGVGGANFVSTILDKLKRGEPVRAVTDQTMSPTYNLDLARATFELMKLDLNGTLHVTNGGALTWHEWAGMIAERAGHSKAEISPVAAADLARPARRPAYSVLSCAKMVELGAAAMPDASDAIRRFLSELKRRG